MRTHSLPPHADRGHGTGRAPGTLPNREHLTADQREPVLDVVIPVYNEEKDLEACVRGLHAHLVRTFPYPFRITVADNASTDRTPVLSRALAEEIPEVTALRLEQKGRGRALKTAWSASDAPVLAYMDVDLSTDLNALLPLVAPLISGHSDLAIGSRLARTARVVRGAKREFISRSYNLILRGSLAARFSDAQCGFKAIRKDVAERLLPMVEDTGWFFDTEMLVLAERAGLRIHEVPVDWVDDPDSTVHIARTATDDLKGVWRVGRALATGALPLDRLRRPFGDDPRDRDIADVPVGLARQAVGFCVVGGLSTLFYLALYSLLRLGTGAQWANALALLVSAVANTAANRRLTFGVRGPRGAARHQAQGLVVFAIGLALTSGSLAALQAADAQPSHGTELAALIAANLAATVLRFLLFRAWVFADQSGDAKAGRAPGGPARAPSRAPSRDSAGDPSRAVAARTAPAVSAHGAHHERAYDSYPDGAVQSEAAGAGRAAAPGTTATTATATAAAAAGGAATATAGAAAAVRSSSATSRRSPTTMSDDATLRLRVVDSTPFPSFPDAGGHPESGSYQDSGALPDPSPYPSGSYRDSGPYQDAGPYLTHTHRSNR